MSKPGILSLLSRYDAAVTNDDNRRHWAAADGLSANTANNPDVRRTLRNRSRYEVANNSYAQGIVRTLANDVIGTGPRLQMLTEDPDANRRIEAEFTEWSQAIRLAEKLRTLRMSQTTDGEAFAMLGNNPGVRARIKLDLRLVEADRVTTAEPYAGDPYSFRPNPVDGIVFDSFGNPKEYHVLKDHPGDPHTGSLAKHNRIPARAMIHLFRTDRPGQARGIPEITPALPLFAQLRRYTLAVLAAAETAADYAGILYTDAPANGEAESVEPMDTIELESRSLLTMPGGWKMAQMRAEQPTTSYMEFIRQILNEIARCLNMPYNVAAGNSSGYNYASGRLDHQTYFKSIRVDQSHIESVVLSRLIEVWFFEAMRIDGFLPASLHRFDSRVPFQVFWDGHEHVDPAKEANAQERRLKNHTTTLANEYARRGLDWEVQLRQRAKERQLMQELGLNESDAVPAREAAPDETTEPPATTAA